MGGESVTTLPLAPQFNDRVIMCTVNQYCKKYSSTHSVTKYWTMLRETGHKRKYKVISLLISVLLTPGLWGILPLAQLVQEVDLCLCV